MHEHDLHLIDSPEKSVHSHSQFSSIIPYRGMRIEVQVEI